MVRQWRYVVTVQEDGDRYRELMGLRCCSLSHQAAPHLSPPPDQQRSSTLLRHTHPSCSGLFSFLIFIPFTIMCLNIVSSICFKAVEYRKNIYLKHPSLVVLRTDSTVISSLALSVVISLIDVGQ